VRASWAWLVICAGWTGSGDFAASMAASVAARARSSRARAALHPSDRNTKVVMTQKRRESPGRGTASPLLALSPATVHQEFQVGAVGRPVFLLSPSSAFFRRSNNLIGVSGTKDDWSLGREGEPAPPAARSVRLSSPGSTIPATRSALTRATACWAWQGRFWWLQGWCWCCVVAVLVAGVMVGWVRRWPCGTVRGRRGAAVAATPSHTSACRPSTTVDQWGGLVPAEPGQDLADADPVL
jgi:hypothetical protein